ncbi:MAG: CspA family cold shock protein [Alphaproteobacteria bacterium]|jgi:CspA family cold shock protein
MSIVSEQEVDAPAIQTKKIEGSLRWFDHVRGYGFIIPAEGGDDVLLHNEILRDYGQSTRLQPGAVLSCEIMKSPKGLMATKILEVLDNAGSISENMMNDLDESEQIMQRPTDETQLKVAIVKWYDERKGYGFSITHEDDSDVMLSRQILRKCGIRALYPGDKVRIATDVTDRGLIANFVEYA